jgi:hypothetical protein
MLSASIMSRKRCELRSAKACGVKPSATVLVGAGQEEHVLVVQALETGDGIAGQRRVGVADVGCTVGIEDGSGDVKLLFPAHGAGSALG